MSIREERRRIIGSTTMDMLGSLVEETTKLASVGEGPEQRGPCPFHPDEAAGLYVAGRTWYCFSCTSGGDAVDWIMSRDGCGEAVAIKGLTRAVAT